MDNEWIPCKKQMPGFWEHVWVTNRKHQVEHLMLSHKGFWVDVINEYWYADLDYVVAWMPYYEPEPYTGE